MTGTYIYVLDMMYSGINKFSDLLYTTQPNEIERTLKVETKTFSPNDKHAMRLFYRVRQVPKNAFGFEPNSTDWYAPNGQKLTHSPLNTYDYLKEMVTFTHNNIAYFWDGMQWNEKL